MRKVNFLIFVCVFVVAAGCSSGTSVEGQFSPSEIANSSQIQWAGQSIITLDVRHDNVECRQGFVSIYNTLFPNQRIVILYGGDYPRRIYKALFSGKYLVDQVSCIAPGLTRIYERAPPSADSSDNASAATFSVRAGKVLDIGTLNIVTDGAAGARFGLAPTSRVTARQIKHALGGASERYAVADPSAR